jgi:hypothetical protein
MNASRLISSDQVSRFLTTCRPSTIRELAKRGVLPVDHWEPMFRRDADTIRALLSLVEQEEKRDECKDR